MQRIFSPRCLGVIVALLFSAGAIAHAAPLDAREREARADFAAGRYQKAVDAFAALFAETADPIYLRNIGRCYQKMKRPQEAIDSFEEYLHKAKALSKAERQEIDGYVKEMQALKASDAAAAPPASSTAPPPPASITPPPPVGAGAPEGGGTSAVGAAPSAAPPAAGLPAPSPPVGVVAASPSPRTDDGRTWRIAGMATGAAGVAFVAVGIAYGAAARSAADSVSQQYNAGTESDGKRDVTLQWVGYSVGVAALATGAVLYVHGMSAAKAPERTASLGLRGIAAFDRNGGAFLLQGSF